MKFLQENKYSIVIWLFFLIVQLSLWMSFYTETMSLAWSGVFTLSVFLTAIWCWVFTKVDDTYIALVCILTLVLSGVIDERILYQSLGQDLIWLLIAAFILAAGLIQSGLTSKFAIQIVRFAHTPRQLFYFCSMLLILSAFIIPATSGRAALAIPIFLGLAKILRDNSRLITALALLFPSVILLSAVGSYLGAGAHLITNQILQQAHLDSFSFFQWFFYGFPLAVVSSLVCTELILRLFTEPKDRQIPINIERTLINEIQENKIESKEQKIQQRNCILIFTVILALWFTETWHGIATPIVALAGALCMTLPHVGSVKLGAAIKTIPWSLLIFMAATLGMGVALIETQAIEWMTNHLFSRLNTNDEIVLVIFVMLIILISLFAHLLIQSRSARSVVLIPIAVASATEFGVSPTAMAFISTAAAGFCHSLTSSAKPLAIFNKIDGMSIFTSQDLLKLSFYLAPLMFILMCIFGFFIWPFMGLEVFVN